MKSIKTRVLVVVFMLGTLVNYANNTNLETNLDAKKIKVAFKDAKKGHQLIIKNSAGVILHTEEVEKKGDLVKVFDFSKLKNGNYTLELEKDFEIIIKSVKVNETEIIFDEASERKIFKPVVRNEANTLMISKIAFDKKPLQVTLFFNDEVILSETVVSETILNRVYKLDSEQKGEYKVIIRNNNRSYTNQFKI